MILKFYYCFISTGSEVLLFTLHSSPGSSVLLALKRPFDLPASVCYTTSSVESVLLKRVSSCSRHNYSYLGGK